jgi:hypothetical protein
LAGATAARRLGRLKRLALLPLLAAALLVPAGAGAAPHLRIGFHDDLAFRWPPNRHANLDLARREGTTLIRTIVNWSHVAPSRPADAADPFSPAYHLDDLDDLVRSATERGMDVLLTIWGTPAWANGGAGPNVAPTDSNDLREFAEAIAERYSGRYPRYPFVRYFSVWNEPNSAVFLTPQFDAAGRPVAPREYARLVEAAYAGIKEGSPRALVGAGETAARGYDRHVAGFHDSESPGRFARLVAAAAPRLPFDAWSHHPYPPTDRSSPATPQPWPSVGLADLDALESHLVRWFHRRRPVRLWVTEFAYRTSPPVAGGASYRLQASYLLQAIALAREQPDVDLFVWFGFRDTRGQRWESGLVDRSGNAKPALASFAVGASCYRLADDPCAQLGSKLTPRDWDGTASFGSAVAISADATTVLVGGPGDTGAAGAAWVFTRSGPGFAQQGGKLTADDAAGPARFGSSVALSADGTTALVGGPGDAGGAGAAWVFVRSGSTWVQQGPKLTPGDGTGDTGFGGRVALSADGSTALIGGSGDAGGVGAAWVFARSGSAWVQQGPRLTAPDETGLARFGTRVALSADGGTALVSGTSDASGRGAVWAFVRGGTGWVQQGPKLVPADEAGAGSFGSALALSANGSTALVGGQDDAGGAGAVWAFARSGGTWAQDGAKLTVTDGSSPGGVGRSVGLSADGLTAIVGANNAGGGAGATWVFVRTGAGWAPQAPKMGGGDEAGGGLFGRVVALTPDAATAIVGGPNDANGAGAAWIFVSWPEATAAQTGG